MNELSKIPATDGGPVMWWDDDEQKELFKSAILGKDFTDDEAALAMGICRQTGFNPITRQIYFVKRMDHKAGVKKMTLQTSIDGFRSKAEESGEFAGNDDYKFDEGLTQYEMLSKSRHQPRTATATVYRIVGGVRCPFSATAGWEEYSVKPPGDQFWKKMPFLMLGKCAEALALRKAFPSKLGGIYTSDEMAQADQPEAHGEPRKAIVAPQRLSQAVRVLPPTPAARATPPEVPILILDEAKQPVPAVQARQESAKAQLSPPQTVPVEQAPEDGFPDQPKISDPQRKRMYAIYKGAGWTDQQAKSVLTDYGISSSSLVPKSMYEGICGTYQAGPDAYAEQIAGG